MNPKDKHADWLLKPTANELADIQAFKTEELTIWERNTTATMLRQQQERLTKYELRHAEQRKRIDELEHQQQAEIEALKQIIDANNLNQNIGQFVKPTNEPVAWKAYEEVHFNDQYILRWVREGDEYVNKITKEMMEDLKSVVRQQQAELDRAVEFYTDKAIENEALRMMLANRNDALDKLELK